MNSHYLHLSAVSFIIFNKNRKLLLASANGTDNWRAIGGWMENETVIECVRREITEELGEIDFTFYDILDAHRFEHVENGPLISIWALVRYNSGKLTPKDDITGFTLRWFSPEELTKIDITCPFQYEIIEKSLYFIDLYLDNSNVSFLKYNWSECT